MLAPCRNRCEKGGEGGDKDTKLTCLGVAIGNNGRPFFFVMCYHCYCSMFLVHFSRIPFRRLEGETTETPLLLCLTGDNDNNHPFARVSTLYITPAPFCVDFMQNP